MTKPTKGKSSGKRSIRKTPPAVASAERATEPRVDQSLQDRIRRRAYELFEARGSGSGNALEDWLLAQRELLTKQENG